MSFSGQNDLKVHYTYREMEVQRNYKLTKVRDLLSWKAKTFKQMFLILKDIKCSDFTCSRGHKEGNDIFFENVTLVILGKDWQQRDGRLLQ